MNKIIATIVLLSLASFSVQSKKVSLQDRMAKLEQIVMEQSNSQVSTADIVAQNQELQQQIAELRGIIEEQNHQIQALKDKQKLLYVDIDSRLAELELSPVNNSQPIDQQELQTTNTQPLTVEVDESYNNSAVSTDTVQNEPKLSSYQDDYDIAFAHLRAGRFLESARAFEGFIQRHPENDLTANAYYWLGESYYVKRQYPQALAAFQALIEKFPTSKKIADAGLKIGYCYYEMDDLTQAEKHLNQVVNSYPNTSIARLAGNRLRQMRRDH
jgi:tol-pal system protein YbgF